MGLAWSRGVAETTASSASDNYNFLLYNLSAGQTVRRTVVDFQIFTVIDAAVADVTGRVVTYGVNLDPSTMTPQYQPYDDMNAVDPHNVLSPWLWWGGVTWERWQVWPPATTSPDATFQHAQQTHLDTRAQRKAYQAHNGIWFQTQAADQAGPGLQHWLALSWAVLIESP